MQVSCLLSFFNQTILMRSIGNGLVVIPLMFKATISRRVIHPPMIAEVFTMSTTLKLPTTVYTPPYITNNNSLCDRLELHPNSVDHRWNRCPNLDCGLRRRPISSDSQSNQNRYLVRWLFRRRRRNRSMGRRSNDFPPRLILRHDHPEFDHRER